MSGSFGCWVDHASETMLGWRFAEKARLGLKDKLSDERPYITDTVVQATKNTNSFNVPLATELQQPVSVTRLNQASVSSPRRV